MSTKIKQHLKAKAHALKPVVLIGNKGLTDAVKKEIDIALRDHELIKIRIASENRDEKYAIVDEICLALDALKVQMIGKIAVLYRKNKD